MNDFCSVPDFTSVSCSYLYFLFIPNSQWSQRGFKKSVLFLGEKVSLLNKIQGISIAGKLRGFFPD